MKTIDERADMYCREHAYQGGYDLEDVRTAHISGAEAEHDLLTRWHDPKEELPDGNRDVLIKTTLCTKYHIAFYKANETRNYHWHENNGAIDDDMVIGWREIQE